MKLTRKQELLLINIGMLKILSDSLEPKIKQTKKKKSKGWSKARRDAHAKKMTQVWYSKKKNGKK